MTRTQILTDALTEAVEALEDPTFEPSRKNLKALKRSMQSALRKAADAAECGHEYDEDPDLWIDPEERVGLAEHF